MMDEYDRRYAGMIGEQRLTKMNMFIDYPDNNHLMGLAPEALYEKYLEFYGKK